MNELRWILIGFGIVLLAGIYLWGRRGSAADERADAAVRPKSEPRESVPDEDEDVVAANGTGARVAPAVPEKADPFQITAIRAATPVAELARAPAHEPAPPETARASSANQWRRMEPTLGDMPTEELPVRPAETAPAPTLSSSDTPTARRIERRKILSLRLSAAPQRLEGAKLLEMVQSELLEHGKYGVFHRLHSDGQSIFSIASMVEPGSFDMEKMSETLYPGVTLFAQLPGPVPGMHALNELVACARRLQQSLGGVLQDERGVPLTVHRIERMRQEVREFERPASAGGRSTATQPASP
jgi:cell division protein ZipA